MLYLKIINVVSMFICDSLHGPFLLLVQEYQSLFDGTGTNPGDKTLEDKFFEYEVSV